MYVCSLINIPWDSPPDTEESYYVFFSMVLGREAQKKNDRSNIRLAAHALSTLLKVKKKLWTVRRRPCL